MKILLLEDDMMIAGGLIYALETEGYDVAHGKTVAEARSHLQTTTFDLAILDMELSDGLGTDLLPDLEGMLTAFLFLTVRDEEAGVVKAFEDGAADYITKPFRLRELLARIKRILSQRGKTAPNFVEIGAVKIELEGAKVYVEGKPLELTALEYKLLLTFANHRGQILSREQILDQLWDQSGNFVEDNTLTVYIKRLRSKLGDALSIQTVRGLGYRVD